MKEMRHVQNSPSLPDEILPPLSSPRLLTNSSVWLPQSYFLSLPFESSSCFLQYLRELMNAFFFFFFYNRWIRFAIFEKSSQCLPSSWFQDFPDSCVPSTFPVQLAWEMPHQYHLQISFYTEESTSRLIDFSMCVIVVINISVLIQVSITYFYYSDRSI